MEENKHVSRGTWILEMDLNIQGDDKAMTLKGLISNFLTIEWSKKNPLNIKKGAYSNYTLIVRGHGSGSEIILPKNEKRPSYDNLKPEYYKDASRARRISEFITYWLSDNCTENDLDKMNEDQKALSHIISKTDHVVIFVCEAAKEYQHWDAEYPVGRYVTKRHKDGKTLTFKSRSVVAPKGLCSNDGKNIGSRKTLKDKMETYPMENFIDPGKCEDISKKNKDWYFSRGLNEEHESEEVYYFERLSDK